MYRGVESLCKLLTVNKVLFDLATNDSIANTSVKTPLNSVDFTMFKSTFILAERDLGFSFAKFKMADQCQATEGELNFHKSQRYTEAREIKISAGNLERTYPKGFRQDIPRTE